MMYSSKFFIVPLLAPGNPMSEGLKSMGLIWTCFLSLAQSKLRLCSANHRPGYWSNLPCDWLSTAWAYSEQETENGPWSIPNHNKAWSLSIIVAIYCILSVQGKVRKRVIIHPSTGCSSFMFYSSHCRNALKNIYAIFINYISTLEDDEVITWDSANLCFAPVLFIVRRAGLLLSQQDFEWRWSVPLFQCLTVLEFSFILFDLCLLITFFNFIMNYVPIVTFWIFTYHKIWILSIMFCFIWSYWIIYFLACL